MPSLQLSRSLGFTHFVATAVLLLAPPVLSAQEPATQIAQLSITLELPDTHPGGPPRSTTVNVQPLQGQGAPQTVTITEGVPTVLHLVAGRYEITSTQPVDVAGQPYGWDVEVPLLYHVNELRLSQENAVRVSDEAPALEPPVESASTPAAGTSPASPNAPAPGPANAPRSRTNVPATPRTTPTEQAEVNPAVRAQIMQMLERWTSALRDHNLNEEMACYAPHLTAYFRQRDVSRDFVRRDKEQFLHRYPEVRRLALRDVRIFGTSDHPDVTAIKTWSFGGHRDWQGQVLTHLQLANENGNWLIVSERERLVHEDVPFGADPTTTATSGH
jgi:hypothetical protein